MKSTKTLLIGIFLGILVIGGARFLFTPPEAVVHHHANFAVFVNGQRLDLTADKYMEDVEGCKPDYVPLLPEERVHMHNNEDVVAHVHDEGVTWGHFFANIDFGLSDASLTTDERIVYADQGVRTLKFIVNGEQVENLANTLVKSEDQVLISYGAESIDQVVETQFSTVADNAAYHNEHPDPGSCSGDIEQSAWAKLKKAFWF